MRKKKMLILNVHELESNVLPEATLLDTTRNDATISAKFSRELASTRSIKCQLLNSVLSSVAGQMRYFIDLIDYKK